MGVVAGGRRILGTEVGVQQCLLHGGRRPRGQEAAQQVEGNGFEGVLQLR